MCASDIDSVMGKADYYFHLTFDNFGKEYIFGCLPDQQQKLTHYLQCFSTFFKSIDLLSVWWNRGTQVENTALTQTNMTR